MPAGYYFVIVLFPRIIAGEQYTVQPWAGLRGFKAKSLLDGNHCEFECGFFAVYREHSFRLILLLNSKLSAPHRIP